MYCFFVHQKTAYEMRISDWSSDVFSSDLSSTAARSSASARRTHGTCGGAECSTPNGTSSSARAARAPFPTASSTAGSRRSEERRGGKECVSTCRYRLLHNTEKNNKIEQVLMKVKIIHSVNTPINQT